MYHFRSQLGKRPLSPLAPDLNAVHLAEVGALSSQLMMKTKELRELEEYATKINGELFELRAANKLNVSAAAGTNGTDSRLSQAMDITVAAILEGVRDSKDQCETRYFEKMVR